MDIAFLLFIDIFITDIIRIAIGYAAIFSFFLFLFIVLAAAFLYPYLLPRLGYDQAGMLTFIHVFPFFPLVLFFLLSVVLLLGLYRAGERMGWGAW